MRNIILRSLNYVQCSKNFNIERLYLVKKKNECRFFDTLIRFETKKKKINWAKL